MDHVQKGRKEGEAAVGKDDAGGRYATEGEALTFVLAGGPTLHFKGRPLGESEGGEGRPGRRLISDSE